MTTIVKGLEFIKTYRIASCSVVQFKGNFEIILKVEGG